MIRAEAVEPKPNGIAARDKRAGNPFPALTHRTMHEVPTGCVNHSTGPGQAAA